MKSVRLMLVIAGLIVVGELQWVSSFSLAYADQPVVVTKESTLSRKSVTDREGQDLGKVITKGRGGGDIEYAVLSSEGALGAKYVAVPLSVLTLSGDKSHFILHAKEAWMRTPSGFNKPSWLDVSPSTSAVVVYDLYGEQPTAPHKTVSLSRFAHTSPVSRDVTQGLVVKPPS